MVTLELRWRYGEFRAHWRVSLCEWVYMDDVVRAQLRQYLNHQVWLAYLDSRAVQSVAVFDNDDNSGRSTVRPHGGGTECPTTRRP